MTFNAIVCWDGDNFEEISQEVYAALPRSERCEIEAQPVSSQTTPQFEDAPQRVLDGLKSGTYHCVTVRTSGTPSTSLMVFRPRFHGDPFDHWFFELEAPPEVCRDIYTRCKRNKSVLFGDVHATSEGLENGAGFLLLVENGQISMLEGYSYDEPWPAENAAFTFLYSDALRAATLAVLPKV